MTVGSACSAIQASSRRGRVAFKSLEVAAITLVVECIPIHVLLLAKVEKRKNQRTKHWLGMLPSDGVESPMRVGYEDRLVADVAVVARSVPPQHLEDLARTAMAGEGHRRALGPLRVPGFHGRCELGCGPLG